MEELKELNVTLAAHNLPQVKYAPNTMTIWAVYLGGNGNYLADSMTGIISRMYEVYQNIITPELYDILLNIAYDIDGID